MNRLQKKCVIGTVGIHLLLFLILIVGPAFYNPQPKADNTMLDVIPANLVDNALNSGVQNAQPPPPNSSHSDNATGFAEALLRYNNHRQRSSSRLRRRPLPITPTPAPSLSWINLEEMFAPAKPTQSRQT